MAWFKRFYDPIILPDGRKLRTYRDAAEYITALPKAEQMARPFGQVALADEIPKVALRPAAQF